MHEPVIIHYLLTQAEPTRASPLIFEDDQDADTKECGEALMHDSEQRRVLVGGRGRDILMSLAQSPADRSWTEGLA